MASQIDKIVKKSLFIIIILKTSVAHIDKMFDQNGLENNRKEAVEAYLKLLFLQGMRHTIKHVRITVLRGKDVNQKPPEYVMVMRSTRLQVPSHCPS
jgi:predicted TPR repeat methyltransferase